ncbi:MAG: hypothetical protein ABJB12_24190 [Pseudomonadota bacterium]
MWQLSLVVFVSWTFASGCAPPRAASGAPAGPVVPTEHEEPAPPATVCSSREIPRKVLNEYCKDSRYSAIALRNAAGVVGGYVLQPTIMDAPISYLDCRGEPLTWFHIFATNAEKSASMKIIDPLRRAFPIEEPLNCRK